jgi:hypothetical protein
MPRPKRTGSHQRYDPVIERFIFRLLTEGAELEDLAFASDRRFARHYVLDMQQKRTTFSGAGPVERAIILHGLPEPLYGHVGTDAKQVAPVWKSRRQPINPPRRGRPRKPHASAELFSSSNATPTGFTVERISPPGESPRVAVPPTAELRKTPRVKRNDRSSVT